MLTFVLGWQNNRRSQVKQVNIHISQTKPTVSTLTPPSVVTEVLQQTIPQLKTIQEFKPCSAQSSSNAHFYESIKADWLEGTARGFGTFQVMQRKARRGINPQTKEAITILAKKVLKLVPGKGLREKVR